MVFWTSPPSQSPGIAKDASDILYGLYGHPTIRIGQVPIHTFPAHR